MSGCPDPSVPPGYPSGYSFQRYSAASPYREKLSVYEPQGSLFNCNSGGWKYVYFFRRGTMDFAYGWMRTSTGNPTVGAEYHDFHAIEYNGFSCFGATASCGPSTSEGISTYSANSQSWSLWGAGVSYAPRVDHCYLHTEMAQHYSFFDGDGTCP